MSAYDELMELCEMPPLIKPVDLNVNQQAKRLYVRGLKASQVDAFAEIANADISTHDKLINIVRLTLCDDKGEQLIKTDEDAARLDEMPLKWLQELANAGANVNGGDLEDDEGN